mmetsp:Transcript_3532/g.8857  ORF Transcript_3532/g.8857 Transcript_3532/m.8857 type:complete len:438 (-) Transcript_3532:45-1358(-)
MAALRRQAPLALLTGKRVLSREGSERLLNDRRVAARRELRRGRHVGRGEELELIGRDVAVRLGVHLLDEEAAGLAHACAVDSVAHRARVGEEGQRHALGDVLLEHRQRVGRKVVLELERHDLGDVDELVRLVVGEVDVVADAARHAGDVGEELVHPVLVAGERDDEVVALVLHHVEQDLDRLLSVVLVVGRVVQVVGLVDEEDATEGLLDHLLGLGRSVPNVLPDQVIASGDNHTTVAAVAHALQDGAHLHRNGRLARAGRAGEAHVKRGDRGVKPELAAHLVDDQQRGDVAHALLDGLQADHLVVELVELVGDAVAVHEVAHLAGGRVVGDGPHHLVLLRTAVALLVLHAQGLVRRIRLLGPLGVGLAHGVAELTVVLHVGITSSSDIAQLQATRHRNAGRARNGRARHRARAHAHRIGAREQRQEREVLQHHGLT